MTATFQLLTVASLLAFTVLAVRECVKARGLEKKTAAPAAWRIRSVLLQGNAQKQTFAGRLVRKPENLNNCVEKALGIYVLGNRCRDDIYVDCPGKRVKIYLNLLENEVAVTAVKGEIFINHSVHPADSKVLVKVRNGGLVTVQNIRFRFEKTG